MYLQFIYYPSVYPIFVYTAALIKGFCCKMINLRLSNWYGLNENCLFAVKSLSKADNSDKPLKPLNF